MNPRSAKNKGKRLQNEVAKIIREVFKLPESDVKSTTMGEGGRDIQLSQKAKDIFPFSVECKSLQRMAVYRLWEQSVANAGELIPLLVIKEDRSKPLVCMELNTFFHLLEK